MRLPPPNSILELLTPHRLFAKLNISSKMLLGYMTLVVLSIVVVVYALMSLYRLNALNNEIIKVYVPVQQTADRMLDALAAQDAYENRSLILYRKDLRALFWQRGDEFRSLVSTLKKLPNAERLPLKKIVQLHTRYNDLFMKEMKLAKKRDIRGAKELSGTELREAFEELVRIIREMSVNAKLAREGAMQKIGEIGGPAFMMTSALCMLSVILGVVFGLAVTRHISSAIRKLKTATEQIAEGNFHYDPAINTEDEIGDLARAFVAMGRRLKKLEEMYLDASPLTRLPGGVAVETVMNSRLESDAPVAFCVLDLDNFKVFNDRYGYAHGNEVIRETARIIEIAAKTKGSPDDFVGHIDGDDFVVITTPVHMRDVCSEIIRLFDERIPLFYDEKDRVKGSILGKTRQGQEMLFPIMTVSIAVVTNEKRTFANTLEASELAAELKDYAKTIPSSVFVMDKRRSA